MPFGKSVNLNRTPGASMGSKATPRAMQKALNTASGSTRSSPQQAEIRSQSKSVGQSAIHRGSRAGLKDAKNVWIQRNNTGYLNPSNQNARLRNRTRALNITPPTSRAPGLTPFRKTFDNRMFPTKDSSACILKKKLS